MLENSRGERIARNDENVDIITGFAEFDIVENYLHIDNRNRPSKEELIAQMPGMLSVYLNFETEPTNIDVNWECIEVDYETTEFYYYQFSPVWDERYVLLEGIDRDVNAPYIGVVCEDDANYGIALLSEVSTNNESYIYDYLTQTMGLNVAAACGVLINIECESSFRPNNLQNSYESKLGYTDESYTAAANNTRRWAASTA